MKRKSFSSFIRNESTKVMGYDSKHVEIRGPKEGYNAVATQYKQSHGHLNSFYRVEFLRFLPRGKTFRIVDLGAGDGRMFSVLNSLPHSEIIACDISEKMLEKYPKDAKRKIVDLELEFPFENDSFDLAFCFFTLEHIKNIENFFNEAYRILSKDSQIFIGHFFQRREFERTVDQKKFKIQQYKRSTEEISQIMKECFFNVDIVPMSDKGVHTGDLIIGKK